MAVVSGMSVQKEYEKLNVKKEVIQNLMAWLREQAHLPHQYITELDVILAYHSCAYDADLTKRVIDVNYTLKTLFPFYRNRKIDDCLELAFQTWLIFPLPTLTKQGFKPIYCEILDADPKKFVYSDVIKAFLMVLDLWQYEQGTVPGVALIVNLDKVSLGHISRVNLTVAQQFFYFLQESSHKIIVLRSKYADELGNLEDYLIKCVAIIMEAMFVCLKEFHFINAPVFVDKLLCMVKPFMKDELLNILKVHQSDSNTLEEYMSKEDLSKHDKNDLKDKICNKLKANHKFFDKEAQKSVDEAKRPGGPKTLCTFFPGMEDSFKKLEID